MASDQVLVRFNQTRNDLTSIRNSQKYMRLKQDPTLNRALDEAESTAGKWIIRVDRGGWANTLQDSTVTQITNFIERIVSLVDGRVASANGTIADALRVARANFESNAPALALDFLETSKVLDVTEEVFRAKDSALKEMEQSREFSKNQIENLTNESNEHFLNLTHKLQEEIRETAAEAVKEYEQAKENASRISVNAARDQFESAERRLKIRAYLWTAFSVFFFTALIVGLVWLFNHPPSIIGDIEDALKPGSKTTFPSVPFSLLLAASAYFTSVRLALIGVLSVGFAVSVRMMRAYIHMREHNEHKLRVTNSIEAFVAAVRTKEQKDLVLSKLVESVTEFGDSGILGKQSESTSLPSVMLEAITKNVGKSD